MDKNSGEIVYQNISPKSPVVLFEEVGSACGTARTNLMMMERRGFKAQPHLSTKAKQTNQQQTLRGIFNFNNDAILSPGRPPIDLPQKRSKTPLQISQIKTNSIKLLDNRFRAFKKTQMAKRGGPEHP